MQIAYRAKYCDAHGEVVTAIHNDGTLLRMSLCGVDFEGRDLDAFEVVGPAIPAELSRFSFAAGSLCACRLEFEMPVTVAAGTSEAPATLEAQLSLGQARADGSVDSENLCLALAVRDLRLRSEGRSGWFEDELADLQRKLPDDWFFKICFGCGLSDYSPAGHGLFGDLACFRDNKTEYLAAKTKVDLFRIWDTRTEFVQGTHVCPAFERRKPGAGYRG